MNIDIKSIFGEILFSFEKENNTIKDTLLEAYLEGINLEYSDLKKANLEGINLKEINLKGADLRETNLRYSDLRNANLEDVDFNESDLKGINLENANLKGANISNTNLNCANLNGANLENIKYSIYTTFLSLQCPSEGSFMGWKRIDKYIIKLKIPEDSERSSSTNIICRCSKAEVLEIQNLNGSIADITEICSNHDKTFIYKVGEIVEVKGFDKNRWNKFSNGIHFFIDRNMAVVYGSNLLGIKDINLYLKQY